MLTRHATYVLAFISLWLWPILHRFYDENDEASVYQSGCSRRRVNALEVAFDDFVFLCHYLLTLSFSLVVVPFPRFAQVYWLTLLDTLAVSGQAFIFSIIRLAEPGAFAELQGIFVEAASDDRSWCRLPAAIVVSFLCPCCCSSRRKRGAGSSGSCCCPGSSSGGDKDDGRGAYQLADGSGNSDGSGPYLGQPTPAAVDEDGHPLLLGDDGNYYYPDGAPFLGGEVYASPSLPLNSNNGGNSSRTGQGKGGRAFIHPHHHHQYQNRPSTPNSTGVELTAQKPQRQPPPSPSFLSRLFGSKSPSSTASGRERGNRSPSREGLLSHGGGAGYGYGGSSASQRGTQLGNNNGNNSYRGNSGGGNSKRASIGSSRSSGGSSGPGYVPPSVPGSLLMQASPDNGLLSSPSTSPPSKKPGLRDFAAAAPDQQQPRRQRFGSVDGGLASYLAGPHQPPLRPLPPPHGSKGPPKQAAQAPATPPFTGTAAVAGGSSSRAGSDASDSGSLLNLSSPLAVVPVDPRAGHMALRSALLAADAAAAAAKEERDRQRSGTGSRRESRASFAERAVASLLGSRSNSNESSGLGKDRLQLLLGSSSSSSHESNSSADHKTYSGRDDGIVGIEMEDLPSHSSGVNSDAVPSAAAYSPPALHLPRQQQPHAGGSSNAHVSATATTDGVLLSVRPRGTALQQRYGNTPVSSGLAVTVLVGPDGLAASPPSRTPPDSPSAAAGRDGSRPSSPTHAGSVSKQRSGSSSSSRGNGVLGQSEAAAVASGAAELRRVVLVRQRSLTADDIDSGGALPSAAGAVSGAGQLPSPPLVPLPAFSPSSSLLSSGPAAPSTPVAFSSHSSSSGSNGLLRKSAPGGASSGNLLALANGSALMSPNTAAFMSAGQQQQQQQQQQAHHGQGSSSNSSNSALQPKTSSATSAAGAPSNSSSGGSGGSSGPSSSNSSLASRGWDVAATLRLDVGSAMLSGLCQAVLQAEAEEVVRASAGQGVYGSLPPPLAAAATALAQQQAAVAAGADPAAIPTLPPPGARRDVPTLLKDGSTCTVREGHMLVGFDCEQYLESAANKLSAHHSGNNSSKRRGHAASSSVSAASAGGSASSFSHGHSSSSAASSSGLGSSSSSNSSGNGTGATLLHGTSIGNGGFELVTYGDATFAALRHAAALPPAAIVYSLDPSMLRSGELRAHFSEGASSSFFCRSKDQALVVKTISGGEVEELMRLLPAYAAHMLANPCSLLCRFYGCFSIKLPSSSRIYFILMGNVFPIVHPGPASETYDLKGSIVGRRAKLNKGALLAAQSLAAQTLAGVTGSSGTGSAGAAAAAAGNSNGPHNTHASPGSVFGAGTTITTGPTVPPKGPGEWW